MPRPTGDAARVVITEYNMPGPERPLENTWYHGEDWMLGPSDGMHGTIGVHDVLADAAGNAWIVQARTTFETSRTVAKLNTKTGEMTNYQIRNANGQTIFFEQVGPDPSGNIWMHTGNLLVRLNPVTEVFTGFAIPGAMGGMANSVDSDSKGRIFVNGSHGAVMFDPSAVNQTGVMYPGWRLFQQNTPGNGTTYGISADADDNVWWSESYSDKVAERDMKTGKVYEFDMQDPEYAARKALATPADLAFYDSIGSLTWATNSAEPLPYSTMPRRLSADKNGDTVWVPNWADATVAEINIHTHKVTYHKLPIHVHPYKTTVDKFHNVYTDSGMIDGVFKYVPSTGQWTMYRLPSHGCASRHVSFDDLKNELWQPCDQSNKVARYQFRTPEELRALEAAAVR
jgi:streptogramin lyase